MLSAARLGVLSAWTSSHPALLLAFLWLVITQLQKRGHGSHGLRFGRSFVLTVSVLVVLAYCAIVIWYARRLAYFDPAEPTITAVASVFGAGKPLYPALDDPERYAHIYGPALFMAHASALALAGPSLPASKAVGAVAILASVIVGYRTFHRRAGTFAALIATCMSVLIYMAFSNVTFWTRSDPLLLLCVCVALAAVDARARRWRFALLGAIVGLTVNLKLTGLLYLVPTGTSTVAAGGVRGVLGTALVAVPVALAPFLFSNVSLTHYGQYVHLAARNGLMGAKLLQDAEWAIFLCAPLLYLWWSAWKSSAGGHRFGVQGIGLGLSIAAAAVVGAKPGGGPFHLLPFVPVIAARVLRTPSHVWDRAPAQSMIVAFGLTALLIAIPKQMIFVRTVAGRDLAPAIADLHHFAGEHPSSRIQVGYAGTLYSSYARPEIVFATHEYLLDAPALQEYQLSGLAIPQSTLDVLDDCRIDYWLLPTGAEAFVVPSAYFPLGAPQVFPERFRATFLRRYTRTSSTRLFDVWQCRPAAARSRH